MSVTVLSGPVSLVFNHLLRNTDWARQRLAPFFGMSVRVDVHALSAVFTVGVDGLLGAAAPTIAPQAIVGMELQTLLRLAVLREVDARKMVRIEGDAELAGVFLGVIEGLRWDVEEDLSRIVGDVLAHRLACAATSFHQWQRHTASNLIESAVEYATEEQSLIAGPEALRRFASDVDVLREAVDRLGKRIERLTAETRRDPQR
ncbi:MAG: hypothetical protein C5B46_00665 [Proteobacteria bacterium]|nr:MAG: hypothetical protein C5B46_00665 [Pseudomonadota bacterium]